MNVCEFDLVLESALLMTGAGGGDPNSEIGLNYVPGSVVRGVLAWRYLARHQQKPDETFRRLFLSGAVRFLHAYPVASNGQRTLPAPLTWHRPKDADAETPVLDFAVTGPPDDDQTWKNLGGQFCALDGDPQGAAKAEFVQPTRQITVHTARTNRQRPTAEGATVFRYEALAAGQTLRGILLAEQRDELNTVLALMPADGGRLALGRSQNAGYGRVTVRHPGGKPVVRDDWQEYTPTGGSGDLLVVTLLSDAILSDPATGGAAVSLQPVLGRPARESFMRLCTAGGFNRTWNLPLAQTMAIAAGSVFVYEANDELAARLAQLTDSGIGQRIAEGYGRIAVNWHRVDKIDRGRLAERARRSQTVMLTGGARAVAETMVKRLWQETAERQLVAFVNDYPLVRTGMENAQLSRLRVVARRDLEVDNLAMSLASGQMEKLKTYLNQKNLRRTAREQLRRAYLGETRFLEWLERLAHEPEKVWQEIHMPPQATIVVGDVTAKPDKRDAIAAVVRLIDAVAQHAAKGAADNG